MRILLYYLKYIKSEKRGHESVVTQGGKHKYWHVLLVAGAGGLHRCTYTYRTINGAEHGGFGHFSVCELHFNQALLARIRSRAHTKSQEAQTQLCPGLAHLGKATAQGVGFPPPSSPTSAPPRGLGGAATFPEIANRALPGQVPPRLGERPRAGPGR